MAYSIKLAVKKPKWLPCSRFCVAIAGKGFCVVAADQTITGESDPSDSSIIFGTVGHHFNVLGGLDIDGDGCVFIYDDFESCKQVKYASQGCGSVEVLKFMEEQMKSYSSSTPDLPTQDDVPSLLEAQAVDWVEKVFRYAIGKDMYAGKKFEVVVINATNGISRRVLDIRG